ncbi:MAG: hypothetical protein HQ538_06955 [Parcubacteria group bacterium]|nr:hypothetical protein [Parcubacteria group bacterium]
MVKLNFAHICEYASILRNGNPIISGIFSEIIARSLPYTHPGMFFVLEFSVDDKNSHSLEIIVKSPTGEKIAPSFKQSIESLRDKKAKTGVVLELRNLKINKEGKYNIETIIDNKTLGTSSFIVSKK